MNQIDIHLDTYGIRWWAADHDNVSALHSKDLGDIHKSNLLTFKKIK